MQNRHSALARLRFIAIAGVALLALGGATFLPIEGAVAAVTTTTINFDEVPLAGGAWTTDANIYTAQGITITGAFGIVNTAPDTGNWGIAGDDGNQFLGDNGQPMITISFATPINTFRIDCASRIDGVFGDGALGVTGTGYTAANAVVNSAAATFTATNTWVTLSLTGSGISSVTLVPTTLGPFGCDKMIITAGTPDPTTTSTTSPQPSATDPAKPAFTG